MSITEKIITGLLVCAAITTSYITFIWIPASIAADAKCFEEGYSASKTSITLESYCIKHYGDMTEIKSIDISED